MEIGKVKKRSHATVLLKQGENTDDISVHGIYSTYVYLRQL
jgi:hypothetical protein